MQFKLWMEEVERNRAYWEQFFLALFNLDKDHGGLAKDLSGFDPDKVSHTAEFQRLSPQQQQQIIRKIRSGSGVVNDLVDIALGTQDIHPTTGLTPTHSTDRTVV